MKICKKTCESGLLVHRSFRAAILACNANIKKGERGEERGDINGEIDSGFFKVPLTPQIFFS